MTLCDQPSPRSMLVLASGEFGDAIASRLTRQADAVVHDIGSGTHPSLWPYTETIVLATAGERPRIAEAIDATAFVRGIPWLRVNASSTEIEVGPLVIPGRTACHRCFTQRRAQHAAPQRGTEGDPMSPRGFARHHVELTVALAQLALIDASAASDQDQDLEQDLGTVRRFHQVHGTLSRHRVVAVDGCSRCRGRFGPRAQGRQHLWEALEAELMSFSVRAAVAS